VPLKTPLEEARDARAFAASAAARAQEADDRAARAQRETNRRVYRTELCRLRFALLRQRF
jgi:hypothetical protein